MIKLSDVALATALKIIFTNCVRRGVFPEIWKCANVVPVHKKNGKISRVNIILFLFYRFLGRCMKNQYMILYTHISFHVTYLTLISQVRPGDSTVNQLIFMTHSIFEAFDCNPPLDVRSVYLDTSNAFDRVWHDGLIFELKRCGVARRLLSLSSKAFLMIESSEVF